MKSLEKQLILAQLCPFSSKKLNDLVILQEVDSTNDYLLKMSDKSQIIACLAEQQSAGKGQRGKSWRSPKGQIYFSLMWHFAKTPLEIMGLSLAVAVATARSLLQYGLGKLSAGLALKWPNDVYMNGKKLAGILVETLSLSSDLQNVVIGIGINITATKDQENIIEQAWTNLEQILEEKVDRNLLAGLLLNELLQALEQFNQEGLNPFKKEWQTLDYLRDKPIIVTTSQSTLSGVCGGISSRGELLVTDNHNKQHICLSGTVRLIL